ncbi:MAG TPA: hypothetical protein VF710_17865 [Longimicrobium sp.]|jgi:hypothetical protein
MTRRLAYAVLALALVVAPLAACDDDMDDRRDGAEENAGQNQAPADTAKAP